jgi:hypothetical protein
LRLEEGFVFGIAIMFEVDVAKVAALSNLCTNHRVLNDGNAQQIVNPMILHPKSYVGLNGVEIDFFEDGSTKRFHAMHDVHVAAYREGKEASEVLLNCFTWEPIDGQHNQAACMDIATAKVKAKEIMATDYDSLFSSWLAHIVMYNEPQLFLKLSRHIRVVQHNCVYHFHVWKLIWNPYNCANPRYGMLQYGFIV